MDPNKAKLHLVVALPCEAKPLIQHYRLQKQAYSGNFDIYQNPQNTIQLIISGIGNINAAAATAFIYALYGMQTHACFLNLGIAGSALHQIGEMVLIGKIIDEYQTRNFYPRYLFKTTLPQAMLISFLRPQTTYPENSVVDMEGVGFFQTAKQCVSQEQIHLLKIISDTPDSDLKAIHPQWVTELIQAKISYIDDVVDNLLKLSAQEAAVSPPAPYYEDFLQQGHFTQYQQHQLKKLLRRWHNLFPEQSPLSIIDSKAHAKVVLNQLNTQLNTAEYYW
jgi:adenosylhomocysteine nucleosidase